jgi:hypothetical protein
MEKLICAECLKHKTLFEQIDEDNGTCSYCNKDTSVVSLEETIEELRAIITSHYDNPENGLAWIEHDWVTGAHKVKNSYDILVEEFDLYCSPAFDDILSPLLDDQWYPREFYSLNDQQVKKYTWQAFKHIIQHERRYFFLNNQTELDDDLYNINPISILQSIGRLISNLSLFTTIPVNTVFYRAREITISDFSRTAEELGAPSNVNALQHNRMNPAGISMFYCSDNDQTCISEIKSKDYVVSSWQNTTPLHIVDFTNEFNKYNGNIIFKHDHFIERRYREQYHDINFLCQFIQEIGQPISDNQKPIDYVPTQVIAEYIRYELTTYDQKPIDGIRFHSSKDDGINYCLFFGQEGCLPGDKQKVKLIKFTDYPLSE